MVILPGVIAVVINEIGSYSGCILDVEPNMLAKELDIGEEERRQVLFLGV